MINDQGQGLGARATGLQGGEPRPANHAANIVNMPRTLQVRTLRG